MAGQGRFSRGATAAIGLVGATIVAVLSWNYLTLQRPLDDVLASDPRNEGIRARCHFRYYLDYDTLVFNLTSVSGHKATIDVFRVLLQVADALKSRRFGKVILAHRGTPKFQLEGGYFQELGEEYSFQNPVYTMRTFPEHLYRPDGSQAFGTWSGGLLGVLKEQTEDFAEFHKDWYIEDY